MKSLTILIPCFRERKTLTVGIPKLKARFPEAQIMIVENGSSIAPQFEGVQYFWLEKAGLGLGLRYGLQRCETDFCVFLPADLSYDLSFVDQAIGILSLGYDIVLGNKNDPRSIVQRPLKRKIISRIYHLLIESGKRLPIGDYTGTKAWRMDSIRPLLARCPSSGIGFEVQLLREAYKEKLKVVQIPVIVEDFNKGKFV
jgi:glycosyltransferase involved in cell wall biosynthesis